MGKELDSEPVLNEDEALLARGGVGEESVDYQYISPCDDPREDHYIPPLTVSSDADAQMLADEERLLDELGVFGESRRKFLGHSAAVGLGAFALQVIAEQKAFGFTDGEIQQIEPTALENAVTVALKVNGTAKSVEVDSRMTLLDAVRERLGLTGSKKGCDHGQCGACTMIVDGRRVLSCLTLAAQCEGRDVTTTEGLAKGDELHPMQAAFIKHDGFQCGFCTPGQICSAIALMQEAKNGDASYVTADVRQKTGAITLSDEEIRERMSGNLCRCGAYPNIVAAIREVHTGKPTDPVAGIIIEEVKHAAV
ncbi:MAG: 2Fe-2S iron-sulfur cluster-binding protein [Acidobacteriota bacterium]